MWTLPSENAAALWTESLILQTLSMREGIWEPGRDCLFYMAACLWETGNILEEASLLRADAWLKLKQEQKSLKIVLTFNIKMLVCFWASLEKGKNNNRCYFISELTSLDPDNSFWNCLWRPHCFQSQHCGAGTVSGVINHFVSVCGETPGDFFHVFVILRWRMEHPHPVFLEQCPMTSLFKGLANSVWRASPALVSLGKKSF